MRTSFSMKRAKVAPATKITPDIANSFDFTSSRCWSFLPPANKVCEGYVFTGVCLSTLGGGHVWFYLGACMVLLGAMHGFIRGCAWFYSGVCVVLFRGACVVLFRGHVSFYSGGMDGFIQGMHGFIRGACVVLFRGACMVLLGGMRGFIQGGIHGFIRRGHAWFFQVFRIQ